DQRAAYKKMIFVTASNELETAARDHLTPVTTGEEAKEAVKAWLRLSQELYPDGFYKFALIPGAITVEGGKGITVTGRVAVAEGGNGELTATLTFDAKGNLTKVKEES